MLYVFDSSAFIVMSHYFPDRFPTFWAELNDCVSRGMLVSVREVRNELDRRITKPHLEKWVSDNSRIFRVPSEPETEFVAEIFSIPRFLEMVRTKQILSGMPVADPFVIVAARIHGGCVVTEESEKPNSAKIPNVCRHFDIPCTNLEGFMEREGWSF